MWVDYGEGLIFWCHKFWLLCLYTFKIILLCSDEGKVRKILKLEPLPDGSGHLFNLSIHFLNEAFVTVIIFFLIVFPFHIYVSGTLWNVVGSLSPLHIAGTASSSHSDALFQNFINLCVIILKHNLPDPLFYQCLQYKWRKLNACICFGSDFVVAFLKVFKTSL